MKIALIGCGYWGSKIQEYIPEFFNLKYIADSEFNKNIIWNDKEVEAVIIATPINTHYDLTKEALLHDKHVLVEKPITMNSKEARELVELANQKNLKLAVEYTQTFSPAIIKAANIVNSNTLKIGKLQYIEMSTKHLGRFLDYDVFWLLASHHLSILSMFVDILSKDMSFRFRNIMFNEDLCTTGSILFENIKEDFKGKIDVSLNFPGKEMLINLYGDKGTLKYNPLADKSLELTLYNKKMGALPSGLIEYFTTFGKYDEYNNLKFSIQYFSDLIYGYELSNIEVAVKITDILENRMEVLF